MKLCLFVFLGLLSLGLLAAAPKIDVEKLTGSYLATDPKCSYQFARIRKIPHADSSEGLLVEIKSKENDSSAVSHHFNLSKAGKVLKLTKNSENLRTKIAMTETSLSSETMGCLSDWMFCGPWNTEMLIQLTGPKTIRLEHPKNETGCTYSKVQITL